MAGPLNPALKRTAVSFVDGVPTKTAVEGVWVQETIFAVGTAAGGFVLPTPLAKRQIASLPLPVNDGGNSGASGSTVSASGSGSGSISESGSASQSGPSGSQSVITSGSASQSQSQSDSQSQSSQSQSQSSASQSQSDSSASLSSLSSSASVTSSASSLSSSDSSSSASSQSSSASSTSTPLSPTPTPTSAPSASSSAISDGFTTTFFSTFVTEIDGHRSTSVIAIPTVLPYPPSAPSSGSKRTVVTGSVIGGVALVIIIAALIIFLRRSEKVRLNYKKLRVFGRRKMLEDEDEDWLGGDAHGLSTTTRYRDYPASVASSRRYPGTLPRNVTPPDGLDVATEGLAVPQRSPYLLGMRAQSSGSIFHEQVWPPPSDKSRLVDPLISESSQVELSNIVDDVMGRTPQPSESTRPIAGPSHISDPSTSSLPLGFPVPQPSPLGSTRHRATPSSEAFLDSSTSAGHSRSTYGGHSRLPSYDAVVAMDNLEGSPILQRRQDSPRSTSGNQFSGSPDRSHHNPRPSPTLADQWEMARAQSPDPNLYTIGPRTGTLAVRNAGPGSPMSPESPDERSHSPTDHRRSPETPRSSNNWLERAPRQSFS